MDEEQFELMRKILTEEIRDRVKKELRLKILWLGLIVLVVVSGVITLILNSMLSDARIRLQSALSVQTSISDQLVQSAAKAEAIAQKAGDAERQFENTMDESEEMLVDLSARMAAFIHELSDVTKKGFSVAEEHQAVLQNLNEVLKELNRKKAGEQAVAGSRFEDIRQSLAITETLISESMTRADLWNYPVTLMKTQNTPVLKVELSAAGFLAFTETSANLGVEDKDIKAIGLSVQMPVDIATRLIRLVKRAWPYLEYVYLLEKPLPADSQPGAFISGLQEAQSNLRGSELRPIPESDFDLIVRDNQSIEEFHSLIRSFES